MPKISIILPVYNVEKYLEKCLESLVNQTFCDIEIIIINDGTQDNSEMIIKQYQNKYPNIIKYEKKSNTGLSDTRNRGVELATGEYLTFVDSDDYLDINLYEQLLKDIDNKVDLIKFKITMVTEKGDIIKKISGPVFEEKNGEEAFETLYTQDILIDPVVLYLYRAEFYKKNKFQFAKGLYHEDFGLTSIIVNKAKSVVSRDIYGYFYVQRENSIVSSKDKDKTIKKAHDLFIHYDNMIKTITQDIELRQDAKSNIKTYFTNNIILKANELDKKDRKVYFKEIRARKMINNIQSENLKQFIKKVILKININLYLKLRR